MALAYVSVPELDLGQGIDQLSAENKIQAGYCESLVDFDPTPEGYLKKRPGYQGYNGNLPVRVEKVEYLTGSTSNLCFYLDSSVDVSSIDLSSVRSTPIIVYGHTSESHSEGDLDDTDSAHYYPSFTSDVRRPIGTGSQTITIEGDEHGQGNAVFVGITQSTSLTDNSNLVFVPDSISINKSTADVQISVANNTGSAFNSFVYIKDKSGITGTTYNRAIAGVTVGTNTVTINAATHQLSNFNIMAELYQDTGTAYVRIIPESVTVSSSGTVTITFINRDASFTDAFLVLNAAPIANILTGSVTADASLTVQITDFDKDFLYVKCYLEDLITGDKTEVIPDSITIDAINKTADISFVNGQSTPASFFIYWEEGFVNTNKLCVDASAVLTPYVDESPELTLWGLNHQDIYGQVPSVSRPGWVTHIDSYRSPTQTRMIAGLGGNLFAAKSRDEVGTAYLLPRLYPRIRNRLDSNVVLGPAFVDSTDSSTRTRGYLQFDGAGEGWAKGVSTEYDSNNGWVKYTLSVPNLQIQGALSTIISTTSGLEDRLTVQQSEYSANTGEFVIKQIQSSGDFLYIWVENDSIDSSDWNETDAGMQCGVFTDQLVVAESSEFIPGDTLESTLWAEETAFTVEASTADTVLVGGITEELSLPLGLRVTASRTSKVIPLQTIGGEATVENIVVGDQLTYSPIDRNLTVKAIITEDDRALTIDSASGTATFTLLSGNTDDLAAGQTILVIQAGDLTGEYVIQDITSSTVFTAESDVEMMGQSGVLLGKTVEIDESLEIEDIITNTNYVEVGGRWIPIEAPVSTYNLPKSTYYRYFDTESYGDQNIIRSSMVANNLYLTNGDDEVLKYDGENIYRAGLFRWQPGLFVALDTNPPSPETGKITVNLATSTPSAVNNNIFTVPLGEEQKFLPGRVIRHSNTSGYTDYVVDSIFDDSTDGFVKVQAFSTITLGTSPELSETATFRYYFRLNAVDSNQNIIASAVTNSQDFVVRIKESTQVNLRLVGYPTWDIYDYDHLEVEVYRTKANTVAPFYRLASLPISFQDIEGYIDYTDTDADEVLVNLDPVNSALLGQELGLSWSEPLRAKYITSSGNRLVLGNIKDYPKLNINLVDIGNRIRTDSGDAKLQDLIWTFRKDNTDDETTTDMVSRVRYQWKSDDEVTIDPTTDIDVDISGESFTITSMAHGLIAGNWVYLFTAAVQDGNKLKLAGWYQVADSDTDTFTINAQVGTYTPGAGDVDTYVVADNPDDVPVWIGVDGNLESVNGNLANSTDSAQFIAVKRLAGAINASMRVTDVGIDGQEEFEPWIVASAGGEFDFGQLIISQPKSLDTTLEVVLPDFEGFNIFVNQIKRVAESSVSALTALYPSRILISFPNYPEIMDNPTSILDTDSLSAIDINPADGQEITGIIPFFGDSAFGASLQDGVIVVFKTNSIYVVNLAAKAAGQNPVQKLESRGLGLTAPFSLAPTQNGLMFANESGIYRLTKSLIIQPIGRWVDRIWKGQVDRSQLALMTGHYYANGAQYKLSVPYQGDESNQKVLVYNTTRELQADGYRDGSWTTYSNHPSIGWANLETDAFFASTLGRVFQLRQTGLESDFRDDADPISAEAILRGMDFGDSSIRKALNSVVVNFRTEFEGDSTILSSAYDLSDDFQELDTFRIISGSQDLNGLTDANAQKIETLSFAIDRRKVTHFQLKVENAALDEPLEISGVTYRVAGLGTQGITQAKQTQT